MGDRTETTIEFRADVWSALAHVLDQEPFSFDSCDLSGALVSLVDAEANYGEMDEITSVLSMLGCDWDLRHDAGAGYDAGSAMGRLRDDGSYHAKHVSNTDTLIDAVYLNGLIDRGHINKAVERIKDQANQGFSCPDLEPDPLNPAESDFLHHSGFVEDVSQGFSTLTDFGLRVAPSGMARTMTNINETWLRTPEQLVDTPRRLIMMAANLLSHAHGDYGDQVPETDRHLWRHDDLRHAAALALTVLWLDDGCDPADAGRIVDLVEKAGAFAESPNTVRSRANLARDFLLLGVVCCAARQPTLFESDYAGCVRMIAVWQSIATACMRQCPEYFDCADQVSGSLLYSAAPVRPLAGVLREIGLIQMALESNTHPDDQVVTQLLQETSTALASAHRALPTAGAGLYINWCAFPLYGSIIEWPTPAYSVPAAGYVPDCGDRAPGIIARLSHLVQRGFVLNNPYVVTQAIDAAKRLQSPDAAMTTDLLRIVEGVMDPACAGFEETFEAFDPLLVISDRHATQMERIDAYASHLPRPEKAVNLRIRDALVRSCLPAFDSATPDVAPAPGL